MPVARFPWISDIPVIDNSANTALCLEPSWSRYPHSPLPSPRRPSWKLPYQGQLPASSKVTNAHLTEECDRIAGRNPERVSMLA